MKQAYDLDIVFLSSNIGNGRTNQGQFLKKRIPKLILIDSSHKGYLTILDGVHI